METSATLIIVHALQALSIPVCIIGELALNYYNVPWVIHVSTTPILISLISTPDPGT